MELKLKDIKKLAKICKSEGIKSFKGYGVEITIDDAAIDAGIQAHAPKARTVEGSTPISADIERSKKELTEEELLFYSSTGQSNIIDKLNS